MMKRISALVLALLMILSLLPAGGFADEFSFDFDAPEAPMLPAEEFSFDFGDEMLPESGEFVFDFAPSGEETAEGPFVEESAEESGADTVRFEEGENILTSANFPDAAFLAKLQSLYPGGLTAEEAAKIVYLEAADCGIASLQGIEFFTGLEELHISSNAELQTLDVSRNTVLTALSCCGTALQALDVSHNTALFTLDCSFITPLQTLNVSGCTALTYLWCNGTSLQTLDTGENRALICLDCSGTALQTLDVSHNTNLQTLVCSGCALTELNVNGCDVLRELYCSANALTCLDLSSAIELNSINYADQNVTLPAEKSGSGRLVDPGIPTELRSRVTMGEGCTYDAATGIMTVPAGTESFVYTFATGMGDMAVTVTVESPDESILTSANFPDAAFLAKLQSLYPDGLTAAEAAEVANLTLSGCGIASLQGIEFFTGLKWLECAHNDALQAVDVSRNTTLISLDCSYNAALQAVNVSRNTALISLNCAYDTALQTLDVSGCTALVGLFCDHTGLQALDMSSCTKLESLTCSHNAALKTLNASGCEWLISISCFYTGLETIDLSGCRRLYTLQCENNTALETLDLSGCTGLVNLSCSGNTSLKALDLSDCTTLAQVTCYNCALTYLDLRQHTRLRGIICTPQTVELPAEEVGGSWQVDPGIPAELRSCVTAGEGCIYDTDTGIMTVPAGTESFTYIFYPVKGNMTVTVTPRLQQPSDPYITFEQEYLTIPCGGTAQIRYSCSRKTAEWTVEAPEGLFTVNSTGLVTANSENKSGTGYVVASFTLEGKTYSARCRIDVTENGEVREAQLPVNKATVELYRTDYATIPVVLVLDQNLSGTAADRSMLFSGVEELAPGTGAAIEKAEFIAPAKGSEKISEYFALRVKDDRTLEVIPTADAIRAELAKSGSVKGSYKAQIRVTVNGTDYDLPQVTLTVKKTLPSVKVSPVKLNSFLTGDTQPITVTGAAVKEITADESKKTAKVHAIPEGTELVALSDGSYALRLTGAAKSGKANLLLTLDGWTVKKQVTVAVTVAKTLPKMTFSPANITLLPEGDARSVEMTVTPAAFVGFPSEPVKVTEGSGKTMKEYTVGAADCVLDASVSENILTVSSNANTPRDGKAHTYKLILRITEPGGNMKEYPFTVKTLASTAKVTMTLKAAGSIDTSVPGSTATVTAAVKNFSAQPEFSWRAENVATKTLPAQDVSAYFDVAREGNVFSVRQMPGAELPPELPVGLKISFIVTATAGGQRCESKVLLPVKITAKAPVATVTLKAAGNIDVLKPYTTQIVLTPTIKNLFGYTLSPEDLTFKTLSGKTKAVIPAEDVPFDVTVEGNTFVITAKPYQPVHTAKYYVSLTVPGIAKPTADTALSLKMSTAKIIAAPVSGAVYTKDRYSAVTADLAPADPALPSVKKVEFSGAHTGFDLRELGGGQIMIGFAGNQIPTGFKAGQTKTVKLAVFLDGNNSAKPNAIVSYKIAIR